MVWLQSLPAVVLVGRLVDLGCANSPSLASFRFSCRLNQEREIGSVQSIGSSQNGRETRRDKS